MSESIYTYVGQCVDNLWGQPGWWSRNWLTGRGLRESTLRRARIGYDESHKAIVIPYMNPDDTIRTYRFRSLNGGPKYYYPKGDSPHLYQVAKSSAKEVYITEGEFDALILSQLGFSAVGTPGVNSFQPYWKYLFAYADAVTLVFDGDEPGREGASRVAHLLSPLVSRLKMVRLPEGSDITDVYKQDPDKLMKLLT